MNEQILVDAGLTQPQAAAYTFLVQNSPSTPPALARAIGESRTNTYKLLERLEEIGLAQRDESGKKIRYWAKNPTVLLGQAESELSQAEQKISRVKNNLPALVDEFNKHSEQPGIRFYQGKQAIKEIYQDTINCGQDIHLIRAAGDRKLMSIDFYKDLSRTRAKRGIKTHSLTSGKSRLWSESTNKAYGVYRYVLDEGAYTAPVEITQYADKVALISFGEEAFGTIIESPQIAQAVKQLLAIAERSAIPS